MSRARDVLREFKSALAALGGPHEIDVVFRDVHGAEHAIQKVWKRGGPNRAVILVEKGED